MPNVLTIDDLSVDTISKIIEKANYYQSHCIAQHQKAKHLANRLVTNLFFEPSTRTLNAFMLAEKYQDMMVLAPDLAQSALVKGESLADTLLTFEAMGTELFVIRHADDQLIAQLQHMPINAAVINAGCGKVAHPTQALIDLALILSRKPTLADVKVALIGDIKHSRVAQSHMALFAKMGITDIRTIAPEPLQLAHAAVAHQQFTDMKQGLAGVDVIIRLRLQKERLDANLTMDMAEFIQSFCLTPEHLVFADPEAIVMHPGPCIVNTDIAETLMQHPQTMILQQVRHAVPVRMAIIDYAMGCL